MIYLASAYSHPDPGVREQRFQEVCRAAAILLRAGIVIYSPISHSHPIARYGLPKSWEFWSKVDREFLIRCDLLAVLTLPGWQDSIGVQAEIRLAQELGLPIVFIEPCELEAVDCDPPNPFGLPRREEAPS